MPESDAFRLCLGFGLRSLDILEKGLRRDGLFGCVESEAGARWNQTTDNHIFLETPQVVFFAHDGGFSEYARCFLERCRRNE